MDGWQQHLKRFRVESFHWGFRQSVNCFFLPNLEFKVDRVGSERHASPRLMCCCVRLSSNVWSAYLTVTFGWFVISLCINKWSSSCLIDLKATSLLWGVVHCLTFVTDISVIVWWTLNRHFFLLRGRLSLFSFLSTNPICVQFYQRFALFRVRFYEILCSKWQNYSRFQTAKHELKG